MDAGCQIAGLLATSGRIAVGSLGGSGQGSDRPCPARQRWTKAELFFGSAIEHAEQVAVALLWAGLALLPARDHGNSDAYPSTQVPPRKLAEELDHVSLGQTEALTVLMSRRTGRVIAVMIKANRKSCHLVKGKWQGNIIDIFLGIERLVA